MKLAPDVLLEIVAILQDGLSHGKDISQSLRDIDIVDNGDGTAKLSEEYLRTHPRGSHWVEN